MNYAEEQNNELEALGELYYNEIKVLSNISPISFSIIVRPQASSYEKPEMVADDDESNDEDSDTESAPDARQQYPSVELLFKLPPNYPEEKPAFQILNSNNLTEHELADLSTKIDEKAEESLGAVMICVLVSDIVEWLSTKSEIDVQLDPAKLDKLQEQEFEEKRKIEGTPVTIQSFLAWKAKFDAEMLKTRLEQQKQQIELGAKVKRLTGREMFESDRALIESDLNFIEDLEQDQIEALLENVDELHLGDDDGDVEYELDAEDEEYGSDDSD